MVEINKSYTFTAVDDSGKEVKVGLSDLFAGRRQLIIQHGEERYRLLVTRSNKLILTK